MLVRTETALTYAGARVALDAALAHAEQIGGAFNVAVTDTAGGLLARTGASTCGRRAVTRRQSACSKHGVAAECQARESAMQ